jgi:gamma-glutamylaminecyclotransferase
MLVLVYGTLKRGGTLHHEMAGQEFVSEVRTRPVYRMYNLGWYPGLVERPLNGRSVQGELWRVDSAGLVRLDVVEEVESGLYERRSVLLEPPFDSEQVMAWFYLGDTSGCADCGEVW